MPEGFVQVNVNITAEDAQILDKMLRQDAYDNRSAWIRRLIRQEAERRGVKVEEPAPEIREEV